MSAGLEQEPLFDVEQLAREELARTPWSGVAPLGYHRDYYTPDELDAAWQRWIGEHGHFNAYFASQMWSRGVQGAETWLNGHGGVMFSAHHEVDGVSVMEWQMNCPTCRWHCIDVHETTVVERWHDHAMPGWRELPVVPVEVARKGKVRSWVETHYPPAAQVDGAPILSDRGNSTGTRAVPHRSPMGGYDICWPLATLSPGTERGNTGR